MHVQRMSLIYSKRLVSMAKQSNIGTSFRLCCISRLLQYCHRHSNKLRFLQNVYASTDSRQFRRRGPVARVPDALSEDGEFKICAWPKCCGFWKFEVLYFALPQPYQEWWVSHPGNGIHTPVG